MDWLGSCLAVLLLLKPNAFQAAAAAELAPGRPACFCARPSERRYCLLLGWEPRRVVFRVCFSGLEDRDGFLFDGVGEATARLLTDSASPSSDLRGAPPTVAVVDASVFAEAGRGSEGLERSL